MNSRNCVPNRIIWSVGLLVFSWLIVHKFLCAKIRSLLVRLPHSESDDVISFIARDLVPGREVSGEWPWAPTLCSACGRCEIDCTTLHSQTNAQCLGTAVTHSRTGSCSTEFGDCERLVPPNLTKRTCSLSTSWLSPARQLHFHPAGEAHVGAPRSIGTAISRHAVRVTYCMPCNVWPAGYFAPRELQHVKRMPEAYFKSLVEVVQVRNVGRGLIWETRSFCQHC